MRNIQKSIFILVFAIMTFSFTLNAFAHIEVDPPEAAKGSSGTFTINVPNESATANTIKVEISFPQDTPIENAVPTLFDEWKIESEYIQDGKYISKITLSGDKIEGSDEIGFVFNITGLPGDAEQVLFKVVQTYDDGTIDRWVDEPLANGEEPEHPAAVLKLTGADVTDTTIAEEIKQSAVKSTEKSVNKTKNDSPSTIIYVIIGAALAITLLLGIRFFLKNSKPSGENQTS